MLLYYIVPNNGKFDLVSRFEEDSVGKLHGSYDTMQIAREMYEKNFDRRHLDGTVSTRLITKNT